MELLEKLLEIYGVNCRKLILLEHFSKILDGILVYHLPLKV